MSDTLLAGLLGVLAVVLLVLNFVVEDAGTLFLILAVAAGIAAGYMASRSRARR